MRDLHPPPNLAAKTEEFAPEEIECLDFDLLAAATYGRVRQQLEAGGTPIGPNDMLIAAHALSRGLCVVTDNVAEFGRVKGLRVENWR